MTVNEMIYGVYEKNRDNLNKIDSINDVINQNQKKIDDSDNVKEFQKGDYEKWEEERANWVKNIESKRQELKANLPKLQDIYQAIPLENKTFIMKNNFTEYHFSKNEKSFKIITFNKNDGFENEKRDEKIYNVS